MCTLHTPQKFVINQQLCLLKSKTREFLAKPKWPTLLYGYRLPCSIHRGNLHNLTPHHNTTPKDIAKNTHYRVLFRHLDTWSDRKRTKISDYRTAPATLDSPKNFNLRERDRMVCRGLGHRLQPYSFALVLIVRDTFRQSFDEEERCTLHHSWYNVDNAH